MGIIDRVTRPKTSDLQMDVSGLDMQRLPRHVAIIMDGNGRWAKQKGLGRSIGHREGVKALRGIIRSASDLGLEILTIFAFSTENWQRPEQEVNTLMELLVEFLTREIEELHENGVRICILGERSRFPMAVRDAIDYAVDKTEANTGLIVNIGLNYGARAEIIRAAKRLAERVQSGDIGVDDIDEQEFSGLLYTGGQVDPELIIRTSGEERLSNFLLYQCAYSEFIFTKVLWPDFTAQVFVDMIIQYQGRQRRFGGL